MYFDGNRVKDYWNPKKMTKDELLLAKKDAIKFIKKCK